ncbi:MAG: hypothetical protein ACKVRP_08840 [Bacteroidota bacterium]
MHSKDIREYEARYWWGRKILKAGNHQLGLPARAYAHILKVRTTIADMAASAEIMPEHILYK